jgi:hypothetical protein
LGCCAEIDKKCRSLLHYKQLHQHPAYQRVLKVADGNPRLLEWLLELLQEDSIETEALLTRMEQVQVEFREAIVAETLLAALTEEERRFLARLSLLGQKKF